MYLPAPGLEEPSQRVSSWRTEQVAVGVTGVLAFPTGFSLMLMAFARDHGTMFDPQLDDLEWREPEQAESGLPDELLRFGVQFSDGSKATTTAGEPLFDDGEPAGPVIAEQRGGGGDGEWEREYWVWPLPRRDRSPSSASGLRLASG